MAEDDSQARFSALVSGTVADFSPAASLLKRARPTADTPERTASPAFFARRAHAGRIAQDASFDPPRNDIARMDPVRRFRGSDAQLYTSRQSTTGPERSSGDRRGKSRATIYAHTMTFDSRLLPRAPFHTGQHGSIAIGQTLNLWTLEK